MQSGVIIYDEVANQMTDTVTIMQQERLYDLLAPTINYISMQTDSLITLVEERNIIFTFNELVDSICYSINSNATGIIKADSCYIVSDSFITVSMNPPFASYDQIGINFSYLEDITGLTTVDIAYTYHTPILGDYDYDNALTYNDLWDLVENWEINNMDFELGPVDGEVPNLIPYLDSKFDIEDGMAFVQMWSWYQKEFGEIIEDTTQVGGTLNLNKRNKKYTIILDDSISAGKIKFTYDEDFQLIRFLDYPNKNKKIFIESHQPDKGFSVLEFARSGILNEDSILFEIDKNSSLKLFYSLKSSRKILSKQGMIELNNNILPEKINLYPIYPNPFNPFATITFDIPKNMSDADVMLKIYDIKGREISNIINSKMNPGTYSFQWNGSGYSSGMYIVKLLIDSNKMTQKIILLK